MKERIQKLIDIYATYVFGVDRDAGWHAPSQLECLQSASMAKKSGLRAKQLSARFSASDERQVNDRSDDKMINEIRFVRNQHHDFKLAAMLFAKLEAKQLLAMVAETYLKQVYKHPFTDAQVSEYLKLNKHTYRHRRKMAHKLIEQQLIFIEEYEMSVSVLRNGEFSF